MGRHSRLKGNRLSFHIFTRTNAKKILMKTKADHRALCAHLLRVLKKYSIIIHAFTPMGNHLHMIIHIHNDADLSKFMCEFKTAYAKYFNKKYNTCGHFWGERFSSTIIQDDKHMLTCLRYIDRNPIKAKLVDHPAKWFFGSYATYAYGRKHPILPITIHPIFLELSANQDRRRQIYQNLVEDDNAVPYNLHGNLYKLQIFGSIEFVDEVLKRT